MGNVKNYTEQGGETTVIGGELLITSEGKLFFDGVEFSPSALQVDSAAEDVPSLVTDFNTLLAKLKIAGLMKSE
jgi:hypothetical protein